MIKPAVIIKKTPPVKLPGNHQGFYNIVNIEIYNIIIARKYKSGANNFIEAANPYKENKRMIDRMYTAKPHTSYNYSNDNRKIKNLTNVNIHSATYIKLAIQGRI